jgi:hypothetical protein
MTKMMRAWCKANTYVRSGRHEEAIYWLSRTVEILENGRLPPSRLKNIDGGEMLVILLLCWAILWGAASWWGT